MTKLEKIGDRVIYLSREYFSGYNSFPTAVVTSEDEILVAFRQARHLKELGHIDPTSRGMLVRSKDGGRTFTPSFLCDAPAEGVQDPCLNRLSDGTLISTFFVWSVQQRAYTINADGPDTLWRPFDDHYVARIGGLYSTRSTDNGETWEPSVRITSEALALRGQGVELPGGAFLIASYNLKGEVHLFRTDDRGESWQPGAVVTLPDAGQQQGLSETNLFRTPGGKLVMFCRNRCWDKQNKENSALLTAQSHDEGVSWSVPQRRPFYSPSPFHALLLQSGKVLITYGYRYAPFGVRAFLLDGECEAWEEAQEMVLREDGLGVDLGYTSAIELKNGEIWVFYYFYGEDEVRHIAATICREVEG